MIFFTEWHEGGVSVAVLEAHVSDMKNGSLAVTATAAELPRRH
jgi:hypothetical protein